MIGLRQGRSRTTYMRVSSPPECTIVTHLLPLLLGHPQVVPDGITTGLYPRLSQPGSRPKGQASLWLLFLTQAPNSLLWAGSWRERRHSCPGRPPSIQQMDVQHGLFHILHLITRDIMGKENRDTTPVSRRSSRGFGQVMLWLIPPTLPPMTTQWMN